MFNGVFVFGQFFQQCWGDGQVVIVSQFQNFVNVMEVCVYYDGFIVVLFVIFVDFVDGNYVWIFCWCVFFFVGVGFVLVEDMVNEW